MPLLLLDLDNTLIDRAAAFRRWATRYVAGLGAPESDVGWLIQADRDGFKPREVLAAEIGAHFGLAPARTTDVLTTLRLGLVEELELDPAVVDALDAARAAGWTPVVVTNGTVDQQERKLRHTGLDRRVAAWVISEGAGVRKPDRRIFDLAAQAAGASLVGAWMIGDSVTADIAGAHAAGLRSIWLHRGRPWPQQAAYAPTHVADDCPAAVRVVLAAGAATSNRPHQDHQSETGHRGVVECPVSD